MGLVFGGADLLASSVVIPPDVTSVSDIEKIIIQVRRHTRLHLFMGTRKQYFFFLIFVFISIVQFIDEAKACSSRSAAKHCLYVRLRCPGRQSTRQHGRRIFLVSKAFSIYAAFGLFRQRRNRRQQLLVSFPATGALSITTECSQETPGHVPAFIRYQLGFALVSPIGKGPAIIQLTFFLFFFLFSPSSSPLISSYLVVALGVLCILAPTAPHVLAGGSLSLCGDGTSYFLIDK